MAWNVACTTCRGADRLHRGRRQALAGARPASPAKTAREIDHIELFADSRTGADSRNFVLCPGKAYDRSPCGTGTSAKLACLAADGKLAEGACGSRKA
jgi:4-hydroxyproline epimerase